MANDDSFSDADAGAGILATPEMLTELDKLARSLVEGADFEYDRHFEFSTDIGSLCLACTTFDTEEEEWLIDASVLGEGCDNPLFAIGINQDDEVQYQEPDVNDVEDLNQQQSVELEAADTICRAVKEEWELTPLEAGITQAVQHAISLLRTGEFEDPEIEANDNNGENSRSLLLGEGVRRAVIERGGPVELVRRYSWQIYPDNKSETIEAIVAKTLNGCVDDDDIPSILLTLNNTTTLTSHHYTVYNSGKRTLDIKERNSELDDVDMELLSISSGASSQEEDETDDRRTKRAKLNEVMLYDVIKMLIDKLVTAKNNSPDIEK